MESKRWYYGRKLPEVERKEKKFPFIYIEYKREPYIKKEIQRVKKKTEKTIKK